MCPGSYFDLAHGVDVPLRDRGHTTMAAVTGHDNTVLSTALGVWFAEQEAKKPVILPNREFNIFAR